MAPIDIRQSEPSAMRAGCVHFCRVFLLLQPPIFVFTAVCTRVEHGHIMQGQLAYICHKAHILQKPAGDGPG